EQPLSALDGGRSVGFRRDRQNASLPEQPGSPIVWVCDATEVTPVDVGNVVVLGQPFVEKRVVRCQHFHDATISSELIVQEQLCFLLERLSEVVVKVGKQVRIWRVHANVPQI